MGEPLEILNNKIFSSYVNSLFSRDARTEAVLRISRVGNENEIFLDLPPISPLLTHVNNKSQEIKEANWEFWGVRKQ